MNYFALSAEDLIQTCLRSSDERAWVEFVRRFQPLIAGVVFRVSRQWAGSSSSEIDDLVQETYLKLCADGMKVLRTFTSKHPDAIYGYIKVFAANVARDHFKATHAKKRGGSVDTISVEQAIPPKDARSGPEAIERDMLLRQVEALLRDAGSEVTSDRDRRIFWLYYRVGLSASAIAALPTVGLSTKGVESTILRLTRAIKQQLASRQQEGISTTNKSVEGIRLDKSL